MLNPKNGSVVNNQMKIINIFLKNIYSNRSDNLRHYFKNETNFYKSKIS